MAAPKKPASKGAAPKKPGSKLYAIYENGKAKNKYCPKCGEGTFLANHKDRMTCGKCGYMEKR